MRRTDGSGRRPQGSTRRGGGGRQGGSRREERPRPPQPSRLPSSCSISVYKSSHGSKKARLQHFFTPERRTVMSLACTPRRLYAGLVSGAVAIYSKAQGNGPGGSACVPWPEARVVCETGHSCAPAAGQARAPWRVWVSGPGRSVCVPTVMPRGVCPSSATSASLGSPDPLASGGFPAAPGA